MTTDQPTEEQVRDLLRRYQGFRHAFAASRSESMRKRIEALTAATEDEAKVIVALCEDWLRTREAIAGIVNQDRWCQWNSRTEEGEPVLTMEEFGLLAELAGIVPRKENHA